MMNAETLTHPRITFARVLSGIRYAWRCREGIDFLVCELADKGIIS